jgi:hypothetical protein
MDTYDTHWIVAEDGMKVIRTFFPDAESVSTRNFMLFSTSGIHGSYATIEDIEKRVQAGDNDILCELTFIIISPRMVRMIYGTCIPDIDDIPFLKELRQKSWDIMPSIGKGE